MKKNTNDKGFTLLEAVIAVFVLSVGILGFISVTVGSILTNNRAKNMTQASVELSSYLESIYNVPYSTIQTSTPATQKTDPITGNIISWVVTANSPVSGAKKIVVTTQSGQNGPIVNYTFVKYDDGK